MSNPLSYPKFQAFDTATGDFLVGGKLYSYYPGTSTVKATFSDYTRATSNSNPIILNNRGEAVVYTIGPTKFVLTTAADVTIWTQDWVGDGYQGMYDAGTAGTLSALTAILTTIGTTNSAKLYLGPVNWGITADLTIPANVTLVPDPMAKLIISSTKTLTINGPIEAGPYQIFSYTGSGKVILYSGQEVYPEWWGAKGDGTTEDTVAFDAAMSCWPTNVYGGMGGTVKIRNRTYMVDTLSNWCYGLRLLGTSKVYSVLKSFSGNTILDIDGSLTHSFEIGNMCLEGNGGAGHGIYVHGMTFGHNVHDMIIQNIGGKGIYDTDGFSQKYSGIYLNLCGDNAVEGNFGTAATLADIYVANVASGKCAYRIYGSPVLINCNGVDSGDIWGIFGSDVANDGVLNYSNAKLINCNIESFESIGILCRDGSSPQIDGVSITPYATGETIAIKVTGSAGMKPIWKGLVIRSTSDGWVNDYPVHFKDGLPCLYIETNYSDPLLQIYNYATTDVYTLGRIGVDTIDYLQYGIILDAAIIGNKDTGPFLRIDQNGIVSQTGANLQRTTIKQSTIEVTNFTAAATHTLASLIPSGSMVIGVTSRVNQTIAGPASIDIGTTGDTDAFANDVSKTAGAATNMQHHTITAPLICAAATDVIITANGGNFTGGAGNGKLRVTIHYITVEEPTS